MNQTGYSKQQYNLVPDLSDQNNFEPLPLLNRLRVIWVGHAEPSFLYLTLHLNHHGCHQPHFRWVSTSAEALQVLRSHNYDIIVLATDFNEQTHQSALMLAQALRTSGHDEPILVVATEIEDELWSQYVHASCEVVVTKQAWNSSVLIPIMNRALQRREQAWEHREQRVAQQKRLLSEQNEAEKLLKLQHQILLDLEQSVSDENNMDTDTTMRSAARPQPDADPLAIPQQLKQYYQELLRNYVIMGSGSLSEEITGLVESLTAIQCTPRQIIQLHLECVKKLVTGLGNRSTRHALSRADLLALELMILTAESYQQANPSA